MKVRRNWKENYDSINYWFFQLTISPIIIIKVIRLNFHKLFISFFYLDSIYTILHSTAYGYNSSLISLDVALLLPY